VQLATSQALRRLLTNRLTSAPEERPGRADLAEITRCVRWRVLACAFEGRWWYYRLARVIHPREYRRLISFGPAYFLHVDFAQAIPEIRVTERVWQQPGAYAGPWPSQKSAQESLEALWDLFDLCRYPEQVRKAPQGSRCAYAEMGRCDAPCDGSVPLAAMVARWRAAWSFATDPAAVSAWMAAAQERMRGAAREQEFELAAQIRQQLRGAEHWQANWALRIRRMEEWRELLALPVTRRRAWKLFLFDRGHLVDGPVFGDRQVGAGGAGWVEALAGEPSVQAVEATERMEQTWLIAHLHFSRESAHLIRIALAGESWAGLASRIQERVEAQRALSAAAALEDGAPPNFEV
jgi:DNA polymerase-3 subunit epsilon